MSKDAKFAEDQGILAQTIMKAPSKTRAEYAMKINVIKLDDIKTDETY